MKKKKSWLLSNGAGLSNLILESKWLLKKNESVES